MKITKKLPDAEFKIMKVVWKNTPPITTSIVMKQLEEQEEWKLQTIISLMLRLIERNFLRTEKIGKERTYYPLITKEEYLKFETNIFIKQYHDNSLVSVVNAFFDGRKFKDSDLTQLLDWVKRKRL